VTTGGREGSRPPAVTLSVTIGNERACRTPNVASGVTKGEQAPRCGRPVRPVSRHLRQAPNIRLGTCAYLAWLPTVPGSMAVRVKLERPLLLALLGVPLSACEVFGPERSGTLTIVMPAQDLVDQLVV
jgi:hypothetical protein